jgi:hypothetical protein
VFRDLVEQAQRVSLQMTVMFVTADSPVLGREHHPHILIVIWQWLRIDSMWWGTR